MTRIHLMAGTALVALAACNTPADTDEATQAVAAPDKTAAVATAPTRNAYFGDLHVHTGNSFDAYAYGVRATPDDAYRFAKGEAIRHGAGFDVQIEGPPLDFLAVTDHGEYLGVVPAMDNPDHPLSQTETAKGAFGENAAAAQATFLKIGTSFVIGPPIDEIYDQDHMNATWAKTVDAAARHNDPGTFTTFAGYEFTAMRPVVVDPELPAAANLHRNVIFRDDAPKQLFTTLNSPNPEDLWAWMDTQRASGIDSLAIPHNSNGSNGWMFAQETYAGGPMDAGYVKTRRTNEPLVEITQIKGTSEAHPKFSPNDEYASFEQYEYFIGSATKATVNEGDYVRNAIARGLAIEDAVGANPYDFGFIGSSDTHLGAATLVEENHWGKFPTDGSGPAGRSSIPPGGVETWDGAEKATVRRVLTGAQYSAGGLAGVWADANTRDALFDGMRRKETFGTTGPRMKVRFFAGADLTEEMASSADLVERAYAAGTTMGGEVSGEAPGFIAWAVRDPLSAPLQRLQIVKVWTEDGALKEAIMDVACSDGSAPDAATQRCADNGARVDTSTCETAPGSGTGELKAFWRDPAFDPAMDAAYYVRVLENPTCRWSTWDAIRNGTPPNPDLPVTLQERAWSSPIRYRAD